MAGEIPNNHNVYDDPTYKQAFGEVDGDRPRILNETIVGPNCGGGNPTVYIGKEDGSAGSAHLTSIDNPPGSGNSRGSNTEDNAQTESYIHASCMSSEREVYLLADSQDVISLASWSTDGTSIATARTSGIIHPIVAPMAQNTVDFYAVGSWTVNFRDIPQPLTEPLVIEGEMEYDIGAGAA